MTKAKILYMTTLALVLSLAACGSPTANDVPTSGVTGRIPAPASVSTPTVAPAVVAPSPPTRAARATVIPTGSAAVATPVSAPTTAASVVPTAVATSSAGKAAPVMPTSVARKAVNVPNFELVAYQGEDLLGGREAKFSEVFEQGKPVVLNFWAGGCPPCRVEMPSFQAVADEYEGRVVFVGVDVGLFTGLGDHESARKLLDELDIRYPSAYAVDASALRQYEVTTMPTTVFFDSRGRVVARRTGVVTEGDLRGVVDQLIGGP